MLARHQLLKAYVKYRIAGYLPRCVIFLPTFFYQRYHLFKQNFNSVTLIQSLEPDKAFSIAAPRAWNALSSDLN